MEALTAHNETLPGVVWPSSQAEGEGKEEQHEECPEAFPPCLRPMSSVPDRAPERLVSQPEPSVSLPLLEVPMQGEEEVEKEEMGEIGEKMVVEEKGDVHAALVADIAREIATLAEERGEEKNVASPVEKDAESGDDGISAKKPSVSEFSWDGGVTTEGLGIDEEDITKCREVELTEAKGASGVTAAPIPIETVDPRQLEPQAPTTLPPAVPLQHIIASQMLKRSIAHQTHRATASFLRSWERRSLQCRLQTELMASKQQASEAARLETEKVRLERDNEAADVEAASADEAQHIGELVSKKAQALHEVEAARDAKAVVDKAEANPDLGLVLPDPNPNPN